MLDFSSFSFLLAKHEYIIIRADPVICKYLLTAKWIDLRCSSGLFLFFLLSLFPHPLFPCPKTTGQNEQVNQDRKSMETVSVFKA